MKKILPLVLVGLLLAHSTSFALVGGPFDNNTYPGTDADGTYSAVITGKNLTGMAMFGIGSSSGVEGNGRYVVFHEGQVNYGTVSATVDLASRQIAGGLIGYAALPNEAPDTGASNNDPNAPNTLDNIRSSAEGAFQGRIKGYPVQITFEADGELSTSANAATTVTSVVDANGDPIPVTGPILVLPTAPASEDESNGETAAFPTTVTVSTATLRTESQFKIRGSRTSTTLFQSTNAYTSLSSATP